MSGSLLVMGAPGWPGAQMGVAGGVERLGTGTTAGTH